VDLVGNLILSVSQDGFSVPKAEGEKGKQKTILKIITKWLHS
jgi:hypothetical protein